MLKSKKLSLRNNHYKKNASSLKSKWMQRMRKSRNLRAKLKMKMLKKLKLKKRMIRNMTVGKKAKRKD